MASADRLLNADLYAAGSQHSAHGEPFRNPFIPFPREVPVNTSAREVPVNTSAREAPVNTSAREAPVSTAVAPDPAGSTYPGATTEAAETHRRSPERVAEPPRTRAEYIDHVLAQIKAAAK
jgi:hypothetical protein